MVSSKVSSEMVDIWFHANNFIATPSLTIKMCIIYRKTAISDEMRGGTSDIVFWVLVKNLNCFAFLESIVSTTLLNQDTVDDILIFSMKERRKMQ